jgi:hypothetical protein
VILEEYGVREKLKGNVMLTLPDPGYDVPIFMFQLGGNETQKIALLDISPTLPNVDYSPLLPAFEKYRDLLKVPPSHRVGERDLLTLAPALPVRHPDTGCSWRPRRSTSDLDRALLPARQAALQERTGTRQPALSSVQGSPHANDPAYGIFAKAWASQWRTRSSTWSPPPPGVAVPAEGNCRWRAHKGSREFNQTGQRLER